MVVAMKVLAELGCRGFISKFSVGANKRLHFIDLLLTMGGTQEEVNYVHFSIPKKLMRWALCALISLPLVYILLYSYSYSISYINLISTFQARANIHPPLPPPQGKLSSIFHLIHVAILLVW
jgi:hypothetical protein